MTNVAARGKGVSPGREANPAGSRALIVDNGVRAECSSARAFFCLEMRMTPERKTPVRTRSA